MFSAERGLGNSGERFEIGKILGLKRSDIGAKREALDFGHNRSMSRAILLLLIALPLTPAPSKLDRLPPEQKIGMIQAGKVPPGTNLSFPEMELNRYLEMKAKQVVGEGLRKPRVEIEQGRATGYALVDFVKIRHAKGQDLGWLMRRLLEGEHPVRVTGRLKSANGVARVDLDTVEIGGSGLKGRALDLLIRTFVLPLYPDAKVGQEFELGYDVDRIELKPGMAVVTMAGKQGRALQAAR